MWVDLITVTGKIGVGLDNSYRLYSLRFFRRNVLGEKWVGLITVIGKIGVGLNNSYRLYSLRFFRRNVLGEKWVGNEVPSIFLLI
jgi:uncharacterized membrane protein